MSKWEKLLNRIAGLEKGMRFEELRKVLESYGYRMSIPSGGSSHCTFRKAGCDPITIPRHDPIKTVYVELVREVLKRRANMRSDTEKLEVYMNLPYRLEVIPDHAEGGYVARYPELPGCLSVGDSIAELIENAEDAKREWLRASLEDGNAIPEPAALSEYSGQFKLRLPKSLHKSLVMHAKEEGVSMNQYCVYLLSKMDALEKGDR